MQWEYMSVQVITNENAVKSRKTVGNKCYVLNGGQPALVELLDELGRQGWELVSCQSSWHSHLLKRPITK
jgi:hypothetical protein